MGDNRASKGRRQEANIGVSRMARQENEKYVNLRLMTGAWVAFVRWSKRRRREVEGVYRARRGKEI